MGDGLVQARGLRKSFGGFEAVRGVDVDVAPGEAFGFLGPNGAGKSSTMRMIACVSPRSGGELRCWAWIPASTARGSGPASGSSRRTTPSTRADGPGEPADLRPLLRVVPGARAGAGPTSCWSSRSSATGPTTQVEPLSGGMKRRLTIARSLVNEPELLLLDEPTTGLDPQARHVLWDRLFRLKQRGRHADPHHALHGRGRAAVRPAGGDGQGGSSPRVRRPS